MREIKYFHPSGKSLPNGSYIQRGGFLHECAQNKDAYVLDKAVHSEQYGLSKYKGGVITFSTDMKARELSNIDESIGAYSIGHAFKGKYVGDRGEVYDETSLSIEVNGISSKSLVQLAEHLVELFHQDTVLVKDLNNGKIFLIDTPRQQPASVTNN